MMHVKVHVDVPQIPWENLCCWREQWPTELQFVYLNLYIYGVLGNLDLRPICELWPSLAN